MIPAIDQSLFQGALDRAHVGIVIFDHRQRVCFWNQWMALHSKLPANTVNDKILVEIFPDDTPPRLQAGISSALDHGMVTVLCHSLHGSPLPLIKQEGKRVEQSIVIQPLRVTGGKRYCTLQVTDVTVSVQREEFLRRQRLELQLQTQDLLEAKKQAEAANQAKSVFLANMSHELRTPLNAILGFSQTIKDDPATPPEQQHILDIINRSGKHLLQLINDVLDMSKIEAGRTRLEMEDFDLGELIRDIIDMMRIRAEEKGLVLRFNQSSQFPRFIHADAPKLRQILLNLLSNAVKFTEKGEVTLRLGCDNNHPDTISLRGEVEDSGSGIATEDLERIFLPFEQLSNASSQIGTGLGLAIARQFVDLMGGQIAVESKIGRGSLFRFTVQVQHALTEPPLKSGTETGRIIGLEPGQPEYRILISEDQPDNQLLLQRLLKQIGFKVRVTDNGEQAIKEFQQWHPHFIWMDQRMPVMDGLTATYRIRELPGGREVKIVALTASLYRDKGHKPGDGPLDDYLLKPYRAEELFGCMARQLGVRYVYERQDPTLNRERISRQELSFEAMSSLPLDLLAELHTATVSLDVEETTALIERVAERDPGLATTLAILVEELNFKPIQQLLQKLETEN